jgi:hypothetical protein
MKYTHQAMAQSYSALLDAQCQREVAGLPGDKTAHLSGVGNRSGA